MLEISLFVTGSAVFYAGTMILMKHWGMASPLLMAALIGLTFAAGAWCEVEALKVERLSAIYVAILGIECVILSVAAFLFLGEQVTLREIWGGVLILTGVVVAAT